MGDKKILPRSYGIKICIAQGSYIRADGTTCTRYKRGMYWFALKARPPSKALMRRVIKNELAVKSYILFIAFMMPTSGTARTVFLMQLPCMQPKMKFHTILGKIQRVICQKKK
jgi:hypothetical protein